MKLKVWLSSAFCSAAVCSVLGQPPAPPAPTGPPPPPSIDIAPVGGSTPADAAPKQPKKHSAAKGKKDNGTKKTDAAKSKNAKATPAKSSMVLNPPVHAVVKCENLDVRGHGSFAGEVITHLKKGETVTVLEEITLAKPRHGEPDHWSRIMMPTNTPVWVSGEYVDRETKTVKANKINVRGGPGENFSVLGHLEKGATVTVIRKHENWLEIETPTNASAFVASEYLESAPEAPAPVPVFAPPQPPPQPVAVQTPPPPAPAPMPVPAPPAPPAPVSAGVSAPAPTAGVQTPQELAAHRSATAEPATGSAPIAPLILVKEEGPRIVTREGYLHKCHNIQGPADFELHDIKTGDITEYVQGKPGQKVSTFVGARIRVTGAEKLDPHWPRTPLLEVQEVELMP